MNANQQKIVQILKKGSMKPGVLCKKIGISRQALHRHLQVLVDKSYIQKQGEGPQVTYIIATKDNEQSRIHKDYQYCKTQLLPKYIKKYSRGIQNYIKESMTEQRAVDFNFLLDTAAVYSSNIEGNTLDINSFLNSKTSPKKHRPKEVQEITDLVSAYDYAQKHVLNEKNIQRAHNILSSQFVSLTRQGVYRKEPVGVFSQSGLEYMAVEPELVEQEMREVCAVVVELLSKKMTKEESVFWATWLHLVIALIHPFSDGNGRTARLCEKWFLANTIGRQGFALQNERYYWQNRSAYYAALKLGVNYWEVDIHTTFPFFALLPEGWKGLNNH